MGGRRHHLAAAFVDPRELDAAARAIAAHAATLPEGEIVFADLYAEAAADDTLAGALKAALEARRHAAAAWSASCSTCPRRRAA